MKNNNHHDDTNKASSIIERMRADGISDDAYVILHIDDKFRAEIKATCDLYRSTVGTTDIDLGIDISNMPERPR